MAGMFFSLKEAAEKISKTEEELKEMVKQGKLREFRTGGDLLFKVDEVEALAAETNIIELEETSTGVEPPMEIDEISLAPETSETKQEMVNADTAITGEGINVLGETDSDYKMTDDILGETKTDSGEVSLEEIEGDVNLDTFGSGSGLLDLSLQADDTSLGGILDEIYTPQDEEQAAVASGSVMDIAAEAEELLPEQAQSGIAVSRALIEPEPDMKSHILGSMLLLPLLVVIYTGIIVTAAFRGVIPAIVKPFQSIMAWYIIGGLSVAVFITGIACMVSGGSKAGKKKAKPKKVKKEKKPKKVKAKKPKPEKKKK